MKKLRVFAGVWPALLLAAACPLEFDVEYTDHLELRIPFSLSGGCGSEGGGESEDPLTRYSSSWLDADHNACAVHADWDGTLIDMEAVAAEIDANTEDQPMTVNSVEISGTQVTLRACALYLEPGVVATGLTDPGLGGKLEIAGTHLLGLPLADGRSVPFTVSFSDAMVEAANRALRDETGLEATGLVDFTIAAADLQTVADASAPMAVFSLDTDFTIAVKGTAPSL